jgi:hypothetical protein
MAASTEVPAIAPAGARSLIMTGDGAREYPSHPVLTAGRYRVRFYAKTTGFTGSAWTMLFRTGATGAFIAGPSSFPSISGQFDWTLYDVLINVPAEIHDVCPAFDLGTISGTLPRIYGMSVEPYTTDGAPAGTMVGGVEASALVADLAAAQADAAQSAIDLANIADDGKLTAREKVDVRERRDNIIDEFPIWRDRAIFYNVNAGTRASYQQSYDDLIAYLGAVGVNGGGNTNIVRADFQAAFNNYALWRNRVIEAITVVAGARADWNSVSSRPSALTDIRPEDGRLSADRIGFNGFIGLSVNDLKPQEVSSNRTETRVASAITGQTAWATLGASTNRLSRINDSGRISDPTVYNAQAILGPRNVTNLVPTYTVGGSNVTINLPAHTRRITGPSGPIVLSYGAASGVEPFNAYWAAFVDDPNLTGFATPFVQITNDPNTLLFPGRYHIASGITPSSDGGGGSSGSGGGTGGGTTNPPGFLPGTQVP